MIRPRISDFDIEKLQRETREMLAEAHAEEAKRKEEEKKKKDTAKDADKQA